MRDWHRPTLAPSYPSDFPLIRSVHFLRFFWPISLRHFGLSFHFSDRISGILFSERWVEWTFFGASCCALVSSRVTTSTARASDGLGLAHVRDAIFGFSNCKCCENLTLKTLRARLAVFDRESAVLSRRTAPEASSLVCLEARLWLRSKCTCIFFLFYTKLMYLQYIQSVMF